MENILNINSRNTDTRIFHRSGRGANKYSTKIINKRKKLVPLFTIGQDYNNPLINSRSRALPTFNSCSTKLSQAIEAKRWASLASYNKDTALYSYAFKAILENAFDSLKKVLCGHSSSRYLRQYTIDNEVAEKLNNLSEKEADTLLLFFMYKEKDKLEKYITSGISIESALESQPGFHPSLTYKSFISDFYNAQGFVQYNTRIPGLGYIVGRYYIAECNLVSGATTPLVCGVIERKDIPYFKAAQVLDDPISTDYLQLWVKEGFDHKDTLHKGLRPKYRKFIKKPLELEGVDIIEKPTLSNLFCVYTPPKVNNIKEYEQFLKKSSEEAINQLKKTIY